MENDELLWLRKAVSKGLAGLVVLHLEGSPSCETVEKTAGVWFHVMKAWPIAWNESLDKPRLSAAFVALASQCRRWPSPFELRLALPERRYPQPVLPPVAYPPEKAQANLKRIRAMIKTVFKA